MYLFPLYSLISPSSCHCSWRSHPWNALWPNLSYKYRLIALFRILIIAVQQWCIQQLEYYKNNKYLITKQDTLTMRGSHWKLNPKRILMIYIQISFLHNYLLVIPLQKELSSYWLIFRQHQDHTTHWDRGHNLSTYIPYLLAVSNSRYTDSDTPY